MEFWVAYPAVFLHMLAAITWAGGAFFFNFVLVRGIASMPADQQRAAWLMHLHWLDAYLTRAGIATIALGAASGIAMQRYVEAVGLQSRWGIAIAVAAVLAVIALACGKYSGVIAARVLKDDRRWKADGLPGAEALRIFTVSTWLDRAEIVLLVVVIALMALARFS